MKNENENAILLLSIKPPAMAGRIFNCREWKKPLSNENAAGPARIPEEISLRDQLSDPKTTSPSENTKPPSAASAYLCGLCDKGRSNAEIAELRRGPQRLTPKLQQSLDYLQPLP
jgi:hypothetical protein